MPGETDYAVIIDEIRQLHRERVYLMRVSNGILVRLKGYLRRQFGYDPKGPKAEQDAIKRRVEAIVCAGKAMIAGKSADPLPPDFDEYAILVMTTLESRRAFEELKQSVEKESAELVKQLPVWPWAESVRGFNAGSLSVIVGEAGDLSNYTGPAKLWKRMGLAVINGHRQGAPGPNASAQDWTEEGYSPRRRSALFVIGESLVKQNGDGPYRTAYLRRKEYEVAKAEARGLKVVPAANIPKGREDEFMSKGHVDNRAKRYMEKRLLRDLWRAWRDAA